MTSIAIKLGRLSAFLAVALFLYIFFSVTVQDIKLLAFENLCSAAIRHHFDTTDPLTNYQNHVDWCEVWWWHPFRLFITLIHGSLTALLMILFCLLLDKKFSQAKIYTRIVVVISFVHLAYMLLQTGHRQYTQYACRWGRYSDLVTAEDCIIQLGTFGDIRLYFPLAVSLTFLLVSRHLRNKKDNW
jgi:hypothetical protein